MGGAINLSKRQPIKAIQPRATLPVHGELLIKPCLAVGKDHGNGFST